MLFLNNMKKLDNKSFHYVLLKDWKYVNEGILDRTHQRFFTEKSLKNTLKNHHYDIIQFKKINKKKNKMGKRKIK